MSELAICIVVGFLIGAFCAAIGISASWLSRAQEANRERRDAARQIGIDIGRRLIERNRETEMLAEADKELRKLKLWVFARDGTVFDNLILNPLFQSWSTYSKDEHNERI